MPGFNIRPAVFADAAELGRLVSQLGYPSSEIEIQTRLQHLSRFPDSCLLIAEDAEDPSGGLAGWIHAFLSPQLGSGCRAEIGGLLVDERRRREGIGRKLVEAVHDWATGCGAVELSVRCRDDRSEAHRFYETLLFRHVKTQKVFRRAMGP